MIQTAEKNIRLYKNFDGSNRDAQAPIQRTSWGKLTPGRILEAHGFHHDARICLPGVHAAQRLHDAKLSQGRNTWLVVIPKGTRYYRADAIEGQRMFNDETRGYIYRAERVMLVSQVKPKTKKSRRKS